jgi:hypothetical protein
MLQYCSESADFTPRLARVRDLVTVIHASDLGTHQIFRSHGFSLITGNRLGHDASNYRDRGVSMIAENSVARGTPVIMAATMIAEESGGGEGPRSCCG